MLINSPILSPQKLSNIVSHLAKLHYAVYNNMTIVSRAKGVYSTAVHCSIYNLIFSSDLNSEYYFHTYSYGLEYNWQN